MEKKKLKKKGNKIKKKDKTDDENEEEEDLKKKKTFTCMCPESLSGHLCRKPTMLVALTTQLPQVDATDRTQLERILTSRTGGAILICNQQLQHQ